MGLFKRFKKGEVNLKYSAILLDLSKFFKSNPNGLDDFNRLGIECFLIIYFHTDREMMEEIVAKYATLPDAIGSNSSYGTQFSKEELIKKEKSSKLVLPHANYNDLHKIKRFLTKLRADNPNIFIELKERPFIDVHNELMRKYTPSKDASI